MRENRTPGSVRGAPRKGRSYRDARTENKIARAARRRYIVSMTTLLEIERAIEQLPSDQFSKIHDWIVEKDWQTWDAQIERDSADGKLDFLVDEALRDAKSGDTRPL